MSNVSVFVDWYSFTIGAVADGKTETANGANAKHVMWWVETHIGSGAMLNMLRSDGWKFTTGRRPYTAGYSNDEFGVKVWFGGQSTILFEISGSGCQQLRDESTHWEYDDLLQVVSSTHHRCTRIDFAVDMETDTSPSEFVSAGFNSRIKTTGDLRSGTGETFYVGSRKSKTRYARVYRWTSPAYEHRAHLLRCEMVAQKALAKKHAQLVTEVGVAYAAQALNNYFKWEHRDMPELENHNETVSAPERKTSDANRLAWLKFQVAPAVKDMITRGVVTPEELMDMFEPGYRQSELFTEDDGL